MRRLLVFLAVAAGVSIPLAGAAGAHPPTAGEAEATTEAPEIVLARWDEKPHVGPPESLLRVIAHDPDGVVWDVAVWWGDNSFSLATTFCVEGKNTGEPVRVLMGHEYTKPGTYPVRVQVTSYPSCEAANVEHETSKTARLKARVAG